MEKDFWKQCGEQGLYLGRQGQSCIPDESRSEDPRRWDPRVLRLGSYPSGPKTAYHLEGRELGTIPGARQSTGQVALRARVWTQRNMGGVGFRGEEDGGVGGNTRRKRMTMMGPRPSMGR